MIYVDAIHIGPLSEAKIYAGSSVAKVTQLPEEWPAGSVLARDFERFRWFSDDYLAWHPAVPGLLGDMRYSTIPNRIAPLWGIRAGSSPGVHADYVVSRTIRDGDWAEFWNMIRGF